MTRVNKGDNLYAKNETSYAVATVADVLRITNFMNNKKKNSHASVS